MYPKSPGYLSHSSSIRNILICIPQYISHSYVMKSGVLNSSICNLTCNSSLWSQIHYIFAENQLCIPLAEKQNKMPPIHFFWKLGNVLKILNCLGFYSFSLTPTYAYFNSSIDFCKSESIIILSVKNFFWESAKNFQDTMFVSSTNVHSTSSFRLKINV